MKAGERSRCRAVAANRSSSVPCRTYRRSTWLRTDISGLQQEIGGLRGEIKELRVEMDGRLRAVEHGQARLEGLLEGLREAIAGRNAA